MVRLTKSVRVVHNPEHSNFEIHTKDYVWKSWECISAYNYKNSVLTLEKAKECAIAYAGGLFKKTVVWKDGELK